MAASVDRTTLVPGETVTDLVTRFKALIAQETDPTKKAAMEAQLQEKEEAIRNKRYRWVQTRHCTAAAVSDFSTLASHKLALIIHTHDAHSFDIQPPGL